MTLQLQINQPFDLQLSLMMGQAFRWRELGDGWFSGVLGENLIHIRQTDDGVAYRVGGSEGERNAGDADDAMLRRYFREDADDVAAIYENISRDAHIAQLVEKYYGMRVLRQDPWECTVAYICSANNNIRRIGRIVDMIATAFGGRLELRGDSQKTFPTADHLLSDDDHVARLANLKLGLKRDVNIALAAQRVANGDLDFCALRGSPYKVVILSLMEGSRNKSRPNGIGGKIADCIALFSLDKTEAFPVDTHIGKAIHAQYFDRAKPRSNGQIVSWAQEYFGPYARLRWSISLPRSTQITAEQSTSLRPQSP